MADAAISWRGSGAPAAGPGGGGGRSSFGGDRQERQSFGPSEADSNDKWRRAGPSASQPPMNNHRRSGSFSSQQSGPSEADTDNKWRRGAGSGGPPMGVGAGGAGFRRESFPSPTAASSQADSAGKWRGGAAASGGGGGGSYRPPATRESGGRFEDRSSRFGSNNMNSSGGKWRSENNSSAPNKYATDNHTESSGSAWRPSAAGGSGWRAGGKSPMASPTGSQHMRSSPTGSQPMRSPSGSQPVKSSPSGSQHMKSPTGSSVSAAAAPEAGAWKPKKAAAARPSSATSAPVHPRAAKPKTPAKSSGGGGGYVPPSARRPAAPASSGPAAPASSGPAASPSGWQPKRGMQNGVTPSQSPVSRGWEKSSTQPRPAETVSPKQPRPTPAKQPTSTAAKQSTPTSTKQETPTSTKKSTSAKQPTPTSKKSSGGGGGLFGCGTARKDAASTLTMKKPTKPFSSSVAGSKASVRHQITGGSSKKKDEAKKKEDKIIEKFRKSLRDESIRLKLEDFRKGLKSVDLSTDRVPLMGLLVRCWDEGSLTPKQMMAALATQFPDDAVVLAADFFVEAREVFGDRKLARLVKQSKLDVLKYLGLQADEAADWFDAKGLSCLKEKVDVAKLVKHATSTHGRAGDILKILKDNSTEGEAFEPEVMFVLGESVFGKFFVSFDKSEEDAKSVLEEYSECLKEVCCEEIDESNLLLAVQRARIQAKWKKAPFKAAFEQLHASGLVAYESFERWRHANPSQAADKKSKMKALLAVNSFLSDIAPRYKSEDEEEEEESDEDDEGSSSGDSLEENPNYDD
eukprot:155517_1